MNDKNDKNWEIRSTLQAIFVAVVFMFVVLYFGLMCEFEDLTGQDNVEIVKEEVR